MNSSTVLGALTAFVVQLLLCREILSGKIAQSFASWALWASLDALTAATVIWQQGNYLLPIAYATGSCIVVASIWKSKNYSWTWIETTCVCLACIAIVIWMFCGAWYATIVATIAVLIAGWPQLRDAYLRPWECSILFWVGFVTANGLSTIGGKAWSVEERLYPACCTLYCVALMLVTARKYGLISVPVKSDECD